MRKAPWLLLLLAGCSNSSAGGRAAYGPPPVASCAPSPGFLAPPASTETYDAIVENRFLSPKDQPLSTFSVDVDTASYANVRRFLNEGTLPPPGAVRLEELVNYFPYHTPPPTDGSAFAARMEMAECPWNPTNRLVRIAIQGREMPKRERPPCSLVFLVDVSGSMDEPNKLPLVKTALRMLLEELDGRDQVSIVVYAGASGLVLPPTRCSNRAVIRQAIDGLDAGGSTNGAAGIQLAYMQAREAFVQGGANRVILCTDGDFNVGVTDESQLVALIEEKARSGVFLTALGFGRGNLKDAMLEKLADKGNGVHGYVDSEKEARKLFVEQVSGTLVTIAKDVKLQVEWNPTRVAAYRLLGYENRLLAKEDFHDDRKDAGDIGAGHAVTAFYEVVPAGAPAPTGTVDPLRYQTAAAPSDAAMSAEILTLKIRHKAPDADTSRLQTFRLEEPGAVAFGAASEDFRFAAAVAAFAMILTDSPFKGGARLSWVRRTVERSLGRDEAGYRRDFLALVDRAAGLKGRED